MKYSKIPFYILSAVAAGTTLALGLGNALIGLAVFASSPYILTLFLMWIAKHKIAVITAQVVTVFIVSVGLYFLLDTTYMERKLEYKFSFLFIPIWQWMMLVVSGFVIYLSNRHDTD